MGRKAQDEAFHFEGFEYPTTTPVPDVIFDAFLSRLGEAELKALLYIVRRTFGFKKDRDAISFNQFLRGIKTREGQVLDEGCGVKDRTTLSRALQSLETKGIIQSEKGIDARGENETTVYNLRFKSGAPAVATQVPTAGVVGNSYHPQAEAIQGVVGNSYHSSGEGLPGVVGIPYYRSGEYPPGVVGNSYPQETVIQQTEGQDNSNIRKATQFFVDVDNSVDNFVDNASADAVVAATSRSLGQIPLKPNHPTPVTDPGECSREDGVTAAARLLEAYPHAVPQRNVATARPHTRAVDPASLPAPRATAPPADGPVDSLRGVSLPLAPRARDGTKFTGVEAPYDEARDLLSRFMEDFAREFNDQAPLRSSLSRLANLYQRSALPMEEFVAHLYAARQTTQERTGAIRARAGEGSAKNKMVYFFGVLENRLGFRDHAESTDLAAMLARSGS